MSQFHEEQGIPEHPAEVVLVPPSLEESLLPSSDAGAPETLFPVICNPGVPLCLLGSSFACYLHAWECVLRSEDILCCSSNTVHLVSRDRVSLVGQELTK